METNSDVILTQTLMNRSNVGDKLLIPNRAYRLGITGVFQKTYTQTMSLLHLQSLAAIWQKNRTYSSSLLKKGKLKMKKYLSIISNKTMFRCTGVLVLAVISSVLASIWPVRLAALYTSISSGQISTLQQGLFPVAVFCGIYMGAECITILRRVLLDCVIAKYESEVRQISIEKILKMPVSYTFGSNSGEKTAQLNQGVAGMSQLLKIFCNDVCATILTAVCTLTQVFMNAPSLMTGIMLLYLLVTIVISIFQIRSQNGIREQIIGQKNHLDGSICQSISNLELVRSFHAESYERKRLQPAISRISKTEQKHHCYMGSFDSMKQVSKILFQVAILLISIVLINAGKMEAGAVITVCLLFQQLVKPIDEVYRFMDETASSLVKARALTDVFAKEEDKVFSIEFRDTETVSHDIVVADVVITDPSKAMALAQYDHLVIPGDQCVALVGPSGCGKTTLVRCLARFYPYINGEVKLFGKNLKDYTQSELTSTVCYMPQNTLFFSGTIRDNLLYGMNRKVADVELHEALRKACILDPLMEKIAETECKVRDVLELPVTEDGKNFSGGQRQRLTLARAFLRKPKLFIFDESTANLDIDSMGTVLTNLEDHARSCDAGIWHISHDHRVVARCDKVVRLNNLLLVARDETVAK